MNKIGWPRPERATGRLTSMVRMDPQAHLDGADGVRAGGEIAPETALTAGATGETSANAQGAWPQSSAKALAGGCRGP